MTRESAEAVFVPLAILAVAVWCLSGCAPKPFVEGGVRFEPEPRALVQAAAPTGMSYRIDAVALRPARVVWFANDIVPSNDLVWHEIKHFRRDPASPTGYCEHEADGVTWIHKICRGNNRN